MSSLSAFQTVSNFGQYLGSLGSVNIDWPPQFMRYLKLDFTQTLHGIPQLDFRAQHIMLVDGLPIALALIMLVMFKDIKIVLWYSCMLCGLGLVITGFALQNIKTSQISQQQALGQYLLIGGGVGLALMLFIFLLYRLKLHRDRKKRMKRVFPFPLPARTLQKRASAVGIMNNSEASSRASSVHSEDVSSVQAEAAFDGNDDNDDGSLNDSNADLNKIKNAVKQQYAPKSFVKQSRNLSLGILLIIVGLILSGTIASPLFTDEAYADPTFKAFVQGFGIPIGWTMFSCGLYLTYNWAAGQFELMRRFHARLNYYFRKNVLKIILLILGLLYIPMTSSILNLTMCETVTCDAGQEFQLNLVQLQVNSLLTQYTSYNASTPLCQSCMFTNSQYCPASLQTALCPPVSDLRLSRERSVSCTSQIFPYYLPGGLLMLIIGTIGVPYLYYRVTYISTKTLSAMPVKGEHDHIRWVAQCRLTTNSCGSLYINFNYKWRYYNVILLVQKLILVLATTYSSQAVKVLLVVMLVAQSVFAFICLFSSPYMNKLEDRLATSCLFLGAANTLITVLVVFGVSVPTGVAYTLFAVNLAVPSAFLVISFFLGIKEYARVQKEVKKRHDLKLQAKHAKAAEIEQGNAPGDAQGEEKRQVEGDNVVKTVEVVAADRKLAQEDVNASIATLELTQTVDAIDQRLDTVLLNNMVNYSLALGLGGFVSFCVTFIGLINAVSYNPIISPTIPKTATAQSSVANYELAGYSSWADFTNNCCCEMLPYDNAAATISETWKCRSSSSSSSSSGSLVYKQRLRVSNGQSGFNIRPYCSPVFNTSVVCPASGSGPVEPIFDTQQSRFRMMACQNASDVTSSFALLSLW
ncbi:hypothetical protein RI367_005533 [Sorochytrium milnesiophthora]